MTELLYGLAGVGVWNAINMLARVYYKAPFEPPYCYHVLVGAWAIYILVRG